MNKTPRPDYGIDAPPVIRNFALIGTGGVILLLAAFQFGAGAPRIASIVADIAVAMIIVGGFNVPLMIWSSKVGKLWECEQLIDSLELKGNEQVLDVGCGRGLLLIAAAKKLTTGKAYGVDIWQTVDQSGNDPRVTQRNAEVEKVEDRIDIRTGDMRKLPFQDKWFDVIVSSLALHNIYKKEERTKAVSEIVRTLKPGGRVALLDIRNTEEYATILKEAGLQKVRRSGLHFFIFPPVRIVTAEKSV